MISINNPLRVCCSRPPPPGSSQQTYSQHSEFRSRCGTLPRGIQWFCCSCSSSVGCCETNGMNGTLCSKGSRRHLTLLTRRTVRYLLYSTLSVCLLIPAIQRRTKQRTRQCTTKKKINWIIAAFLLFEVLIPLNVAREPSCLFQQQRSRAEPGRSMAGSSSSVSDSSPRVHHQRRISFLLNFN